MMMKQKVQRAKEQPDHLINLLNENVENLEDCVIVWLDPNMSFPDSSSTKLRTIVNYLKIFQNTDDVMHYISAVSIEHQQLFLIVSGRTGEYVVPLIHEFQHVNSIYVYCTVAEKHREWTKNYSKIRGIFVEEICLYEKLKNDVNLFLSQLPLSLIGPEKTSQDPHQSGSFLWSQLLLEILLRLPPSIRAKDDMIEQSLMQYEGNGLEIGRIEKFRDTYSSEDAVNWYTMDSFIYRLVNKALRTEEIDQIFKYRFFICDLYKKLEELHPEYAMTVQKPLCVYRGQIMATAEFKKIESSISKYISINTFFSTSTNSLVALGFLADASSYRPAFSPVLFEIEIDAAFSSSKPFAAINQLSVNQEEYEVLFSMGTIFQIQECYSLTDDISIVKLRLSNETDQDIKDIFSFYQQQIGTSSSLMKLGEFLHKISEFDKAERYYELVIQELNDIDPSECGMAYNNIGTIYTDRQQERKALEYFRKALSIYSKTLPKIHLYVAEVYSNMASAYIEIDAFKLAFKYFRKTLKIQRQLLAKDDLALATTYNNMSDLYSRVERHDKQLAYLKMAFAIEQVKLPAKHPDLAVTYNNLSHAYLELLDYDNAKDCLEKALAIRLISVPADHSDLADTYFGLGTLAHETGDSINSLENYQKALNIFSSQKSGPNHQRLAQVHSDLGLCFMEQGLHSASMQHLNLALFHEKQKEHRDISNVMGIYNNLAQTYTDQNNYKLAMKYCQKSLRLNAKYPEKHRRVRLITKNIIANLYRLTDKLNKALKLYQYLVVEWGKYGQPEDVLRLALVYKEISFVYQEKMESDLSLHYIKKSLKLQRRYGSTDYNLLAEIYLTIGELYDTDNKNLGKAIFYYKKAIDLYLKDSSPKSTALTEAYISLSRLLHFKAKCPLKAKFYLLKARDLLLGMNLANWYAFAKTYINLGLIAEGKEQCNKARKNYRRALFYLLKSRRKNLHVKSMNICDIVFLYNKITGLFIKESDLSQAEFYCFKAFKFARILFGTDEAKQERFQIELATIDFNLGCIYMERGKFRRAGEKFQSAYTIFKECSSSHPLLRGLISYHMGTIWQQRKRYEKALPCFRNARRFALKSDHPGKNRDIGTAYIHIAMCYQYQKHAHSSKARANYEKARTFFQQLKTTTEHDSELLDVIEINLKKLSNINTRQMNSE